MALAAQLFPCRAQHSDGWVAVRLYFELARKAAQRQLAYRQANLAGLLTNLFFGALRAYVLIALYGTRPEIAGYTLSAAVTYTGLTQAALRAVQIFGWLDLMKTVRSGDIVSDLSKPFDYYFFWLAQDLGADVVHLIVRGVPIILAYALATPLVWPASLGAALMFTLSLLLAMLVSFAWRFCINITALWTTDALGVARLGYTVAMFFSGFLVPVSFFPPWLKALAYATPFPAMIELPVQIWVGILDGPAVMTALIQQTLWFVALMILGRLMLAAGIRKLVIQGG
jgi:ABC-2 type transport system permease protein